MNIIFTGSKSSACSNTWNKNLCKTILNENSINTPNSILLNNLKIVQIIHLIALKKSLATNLIYL